MKKLIFNYITGNRFDGYVVTYFKDNGEEINLTLHPYNNYLYYEKNLNFDFPYLPKYNTMFTGPVYFESSPDESFFDPYSVSYLSNSSFVRTRSNITTPVLTMTNKAFAYPLRYQNFVKTNHYLNDFYFERGDYDRIYTQYNVYNTEKGSSVEVNCERRISIVEEQYIKESFATQLSMSIPEIETQLGKGYKDILKDSALSSVTYVKTIVATTESPLDHNTKLSLSFQGSYTREYYEYKQNFVPSGAVFPSDDPAQYVPIIQNDEKMTDVYIPNYFEMDYEDPYNSPKGTGFEIPTSGDNIKIVEKTEGLPDYISFRDTIFVLDDFENGAMMILLPVFNEDNMDDFYLQNVKTGLNYHLPPLSAGLLTQDLRRVRLKKDVEGQKWILEFSTSATSENSQIGHFEAPITFDPWKNIVDAEGNLNMDNLFYMYYVDQDGVANYDAVIAIYRYIFYGGVVGPCIPELFGDNRFNTNAIGSADKGTYLKPNYKIYDDGYQKSTYVACDIASYSILI
jgi:hypothetical protein